MANEQRAIPRDEWAAYFERLGRDYRGGRATVERLGPGGGAEALAEGVPFDAVDGDGGLAIGLGDGDRHVVGRPSAVREAPTADGNGLVVTIEAAGEATVRVTLEGPAAQAVGGGASGGDAPGVGDDAGAQITFGASDDMGGVASVGGGSIGDQDLSGRRSYDIAADVAGDGVEGLLDDAGEAGGHAGPGSANEYSGAAPVSEAAGSTGAKIQRHRAEIIDGGSGQGVIDPTADPIGGRQLVPGDDDSDPYVEGEVGAQAERPLDEVEGETPDDRRRATDPGPADGR